MPMHCGCMIHWLPKATVEKIRAGQAMKCKKCDIILQFGTGDFEPGERRKVHPIQRSLKPEREPGTADAWVRDQLRNLRKAGINEPQFVVRNETLMQAICEKLGVDRDSGRKHVRKLWEELT